jgi:hypothetical protein
MLKFKDIPRDVIHHIILPMKYNNFINELLKYIDLFLERKDAVHYKFGRLGSYYYAEKYIHRSLKTQKRLEKQLFGRSKTLHFCDFAFNAFINKHQYIAQKALKILCDRKIIKDKVVDTMVHYEYPDGYFGR